MFDLIKFNWEAFLNQPSATVPDSQFIPNCSSVSIDNFQDSRSKNGSLLLLEMSRCLFVTTFWKEDLLNLTNFGAVYLTQFLTDFSQILDSKSYDQA